METFDTAEFNFLTEEEKTELLELIGAAKRPLWKPFPGPQTLAAASTADVIGYGGQAGGGKTDFGLGYPIMHHQRVQFFRKNSTEFDDVLLRMEEIVGSQEGLKQRPNLAWQIPGKDCRITFGSIPNRGDEQKFRGRPKDCLVIDEAAEFLEPQVRFLMGWIRSTKPGQKCRTILTFNPPSDPANRWIVKYFAPWIDKNYNGQRAMPGELRYFARIDDQDLEVANGAPFIHQGLTLKPQSRTFIPASLKDNPALSPDYVNTIAALPEPLRSQLLYGNFEAGISDHAYQVIPSAWITAAMERWKPVHLWHTPLIMDTLGVDVARGGADKTVLAPKYGAYFGELTYCKGTETPDGPLVVSEIVKVLRDGAQIQIDVIGVGASPHDHAIHINLPSVPINVSKSAPGSDVTGLLTFENLRAYMWWKMREALDPQFKQQIALPPDPQLEQDLAAPRFKPEGRHLIVESNDHLRERLGRSPDAGTAVCLANLRMPRVTLKTAYERSNEVWGAQSPKQAEYDPLSAV